MSGPLHTPAHKVDLRYEMYLRYVKALPKGQSPVPYKEWQPHYLDEHPEFNFNEGISL